MCLAVPVRIIEISDEKTAVAEKDGVKISVSTMLLEDKPSIGDFVLLHAGFAIEKIREEDFTEKQKLWDEFYKKTGR
ncbi:MAG: HypC/HybG/HupF family hydrogenase formation chaperone [Oligoflexia bacterium]|nr:HypC/HybG/HupF family hydrogenase formation chaperone [Oligoflexia bacterium]